MTPVTDPIRELLEGQLDMAWKLLDLHLTGLTDEECLWRPAPEGLHVREEEGVWRAEWPDSEAYAAGPPSIAWLTWHIGFWWSMTLDHSFGDATLTRGDVTWPGTADATRAWLTALHGEWTAAQAALPDDELLSPTHTRWPLEDAPFYRLSAWLNQELMKNAAEIGYARFLYGARQGRGRP